MYTNKSNHRKRNPIRNKKRGGRAIAAGTYGCVFSPQLLCKGQREHMRNNKMISKLMLTEYLDEEWNEMSKIIPYIEQIPNHENYFLININTCPPAKLFGEDSLGYKKKCSNFISDFPTVKDVNNNIGEFRILNMPNGGESVNDYLEKCTSSVSFNELKKSLVDLLQHGILPLNRQNVYHLDIKSPNIMFSTEDKHARLIDWGFTKILNNIKVDFNNKDNTFYNGFQFNVPVSSILLNSKINEWLSGKTGLHEQVMTIIDEKKSGGHLAFIISYYTDCILDSEEADAMDFIYSYISKVIENPEYVSTDVNNNLTFNIPKYLQEVYLKNVDVWGFLTVFFGFFNNNADYTRIKNIIDIKKSVRKIINNYLFNEKYATMPIPVDKLILDLNKIVAIDDDTPPPVIAPSVLADTKSDEKKTDKLFNPVTKRFINNTVANQEKIKKLTIKSGGKKKTRRKNIKRHNHTMRPSAF